MTKKVYKGRKSAVQGIDLEFDNEGVRYIVAIKSGPNWGNSSQIAKMRSDFKTASKTLRTFLTFTPIITRSGLVQETKVQCILQSTIKIILRNPVR